MLFLSRYTRAFTSSRTALKKFSSLSFPPASASLRPRLALLRRASSTAKSANPLRTPRLPGQRPVAAATTSPASSSGAGHQKSPAVSRDSSAKEKRPSVARGKVKGAKEERSFEELFEEAIKVRAPEYDEEGGVDVRRLAKRRPGRMQEAPSKGPAGRAARELAAIKRAREGRLAAAEHDVSPVVDDAVVERQVQRLTGATGAFVDQALKKTFYMALEGLKDKKVRMLTVERVFHQWLRVGKPSPSAATNLISAMDEASQATNASYDKEVSELFELCKRANIADAIMYNAVIQFWRSRDPNKALEVFDELKSSRGIQADSQTHTLVIDTYGVLGRVDDALEHFREHVSAAYAPAHKQRGNPVSVMTLTALVGVLTAHNRYDDALQVAEEMEKLYQRGPSVAVYDSVISAMGRAGMIQEANQVFRKHISRSRKFKPLRPTFSAMMEAHSFSGDVVGVMKWWDRLQNKLKPTPLCARILLESLVRAHALPLNPVLDGEHVSDKQFNAIADGVMDELLLSKRLTGIKLSNSRWRFGLQHGIGVLLPLDWKLRKCLADFQNHKLDMPGAGVIVTASPPRFKATRPVTAANPLSIAAWSLHAMKPPLDYKFREDFVRIPRDSLIQAFARTKQSQANDNSVSFLRPDPDCLGAYVPVEHRRVDVPTEAIPVRALQRDAPAAADQIET